MSSVSVKIWPEAQRELAFGSIGASYTAVGTRLEEPSVLFEIYNLTDVALQFSVDGTTDHFPLMPGGVIRDFSSNKGIGDSLSLAAITQVYVKELSDSPTEGGVYVVTWYRKKG